MVCSLGLEFVFRVWQKDLGATDASWAVVAEAGGSLSYAGLQSEFG